MLPPQIRQWQLHRHPQAFGGTAKVNNQQRPQWIAKLVCQHPKHIVVQPEEVAWLGFCKASFVVEASVVGGLTHEVWEPEKFCTPRVPKGWLRNRFPLPGALSPRPLHIPDSAALTSETWRILILDRDPCPSTLALGL